MKYTHDWNKSARRHTAWWQGQLIDRCCISVTAPTATPKPQPKYSSDEVVKLWTDPDWLYEQWSGHFANTYFAGDAFPNLWLNLGPSGHAGYVKGAKYTFMHSVALNCTTWYNASIDNWEDDFPVFDRQGFLYQKTLELARALSEKSKGDFMVSMPDISGNLDALAHLRDSSELLVDMLAEPKAVLRAGEAMEAIWEASVAEVYALTRQNNQDASSIGWMQVWAPGLCAQMQCDLSVMISPDDYRTFALPELTRQCDFLEYPLYHFDGQEQLRHLDTLLGIEKLRAIQWTPVDGQPSPVEFIPDLRRILAAGKSLYLMLNPQEVEPILRALPSAGLSISVTAETPKQADELVRLAERLTHE